MTRIFLKSIVVLATLALYLLPAFGQSPEKMSYQAVVRNSEGKLVANKQVGMKISILQGATDGTAVYAETHKPKTNANGLVSIEIGGGTVVSGNFVGINWASGTYFIKTETDPAGGSNYTITGTSQLLSVPYALHAKTAENITGGITETDPQFAAWDKSTGISISKSQITDFGTYLASETDPVFMAWDKDYNDLNNKPTLFSGNYNDLSNKPNLGIYATKNMGNKKITNLATPTDAKDAVNKAYVDALLAKISELEIVANGFIDERDNTHYNTVKIGNQIWMAENLKYLPSVNQEADFSNTEAKYYVYGYDGTSVFWAREPNYFIYGVLYNWPAAMNGALSSNTNPSGVQGICPTGWHLPSAAEFEELEDYLGTNGGGQLKEIGTYHWQSPNGGATNTTGFTALPAGASVNGAFVELGETTIF